MHKGTNVIVLCVQDKLLSHKVFFLAFQLSSK